MTVSHSPAVHLRNSEREALRALRAELRPFGVRVRVDAHHRTRYHFTARDRSLYSTDDRLSALAFGAGLVAGFTAASTTTNTRMTA